jgi:uncharacterized CHY-type Zn-finger protein
MSRPDQKGEAIQMKFEHWHLPPEMWDTPMTCSDCGNEITGTTYVTCNICQKVFCEECFQKKHLLAHWPEGERRQSLFDETVAKEPKT